LCNFGLYLLAALVLLALFCLIYGWFTPYPEMQLIREGKVAAAISFGGAVLGFVIPLASAISNSVSFIDMLIWAAIALLVQIVVFVALRVAMKNLIKEIVDNHTAAATLLAVLSIAAGILSAASMTY
jgi:putative membrane protein